MVCQGLTDYFSELGLLLYKNLLMSWRAKKQTACQLFSPVIFVILLFGCSYIVMMADTPNPLPAAPPSTVPLCVPKHGSCLTLVWAIDPENFSSPFWAPRVFNESVIVNIMNNFMASTGLVNGKDVVRFNSSAAIDAYTMAHPNTTSAGIVFYPVSDPWFDPLAPALDFPATNRIPYAILYNSTENTDVVVNRIFNAVSYNLERAILRAIVGDANVANLPEMMELEYPKLWKMSKFDAITYMGPILFYCAIMFNFLFLLYQIVSEKELLLRQQMKIVGMHDSTYWLSFFLHNIVLVTFFTLITILTGACCQLAFFMKANFFAVFLTFWLFGFATIPLAFFISMLVKTTRAATNAGMGVFLFGVVMQIISTNPFLVQQMYNPDFPGILRTIFYVWPPFNFAKLVIDIAGKSRQVDLNTKGATFFTWSDLYKETKMGAGFVYSAPVDSMYYLILNFIIFTVISIVLYNVLPSEGGWLSTSIARWKASGNREKKPAGIEMMEVPDEDVAKEEAAIDSSPSSDGVVVRHFIKTYYNSIFRKTDKDVHAVRDLSFQVHEGEIFVLLGHNGCGKTTTMSALCGLRLPTQGDATIFGHSIVSDLNEVRKLIGVCPQDDVIWPDLTAAEHLYIFGRLKKVPKDDLKNEIEERLKDVGLYDVRNRIAGTFSGGMKRRLSVAISCIGNSRLLLLDEPTTGLDPVSRRQMWASLQKLKKNKAVILTTHSMEEAEALGDKVSVMKAGKMKCVGTPLHLKAKHGVGYVVHLNACEGLEDQAVSYVKANLPHAFPITKTSGSLKYGIPQENLEQLSEFLSFLEAHKAKVASGESLDPCPIIEWGVSQTTLEEVFLRVCGHSDNTPVVTPVLTPVLQDDEVHDTEVVYE